MQKRPIIVSILLTVSYEHMCTCVVCVLSLSHTHTHIHAHAQTHFHTHTHTHTSTHTHTHTHTHPHTLISPPLTHFLVRTQIYSLSHSEDMCAPTSNLNDTRVFRGLLVHSPASLHMQDTCVHVQYSSAASHTRSAATHTRIACRRHVHINLQLDSRHA